MTSSAAHSPIPMGQRDRAREILRAIGETLQWWLLGKCLAMIVVGSATAVGLWLLNVPQVLTFGLMSALLTFIPNIGPIISAIPPALLTLTQGTSQVLYVGIQGIESYLLTPLVQQRTVSLPPALTVSAQVLLGVLVGGFGIIVATPLTAAALMLVKMLVVEEEPEA